VGVQSTLQAIENLHQTFLGKNKVLDGSRISIPMMDFFRNLFIRSFGKLVIKGSIIDLHQDIFFFLILILVFVLWMLVRALWHFHEKKNPIPQRIVHGTTIKTTILTTIFAVSSFDTSDWVAECSGNRAEGGPPQAPVPGPAAGNQPEGEFEASQQSLDESIRRELTFLLNIGGTSDRVLLMRFWRALT